MKYVLTGVRGFIASEIARQLLSIPDAEIVGIDDDSKGYGDRNIVDIVNNKRLEILPIDLSRPNGAELLAIHNAVSQADYVISAASKIGGISYFNLIPATIIRDNNLINTTLLDAIQDSEFDRNLIYKKRGWPRFIYISSSMVFESATSFPSKESDVKKTIVPKTSYGMSKLCGEYYCEAYAKQFGLEYTIIRPFNAIGPEKPDPKQVGFSHVLPDLVYKIAVKKQGTKENPLEILGNGEQVRHYTHVSDIANGLITAIHSEKSINQDFNVSTPTGHSVKELAQVLFEHINNTKERVVFKELEPFIDDVQYRSPDVSKMKEFFGWEAKHTLDSCKKEVIDAVLNLI